MLITVLTVIHVSMCVILIIIVLLQQGKGSEMGPAVGAGTQAIFGARGAATLLSKITTGAAVTFMITSLSLAYLSAKDSSSSLLKDPPPAETPAATPSPTSTATPSVSPSSPPATSDAKGS